LAMSVILFAHRHHLTVVASWWVNLQECREVPDREQTAGVMG
jgi:hypothetical protein